ncbi:uncharacterized protein LOC103696780 isoform X1 [Phoenix dactylifera]|uniref:RNA-directed DNA polymerase n=1 Tax=Phoenix dactylifera TaxID=42345 RepID=A0A8B8ZMQ5_PHODC|nr:uncharacterized protein LOC103696780 isoform X1 [Phoenix dactylifera]
MSNKERIERLEVDVNTMQEELHGLEARMEVRLTEVLEAIRHLQITVQSPPPFEPTASLPPSPREGALRRTEDIVGVQRHPRMDFPRFTGNDPIVWLDRAEQFFDGQGVPANRRVITASFYLDEEANHWWQWLRRMSQDEGVVITWRVFERELLARFGPNEYINFNEKLSRIQQHGTVREYQQEFEKLANRVRGWPPDALIGTFVGGLKEEIAKEVRMRRPHSLREAVTIARMREERLEQKRKAFRGVASRVTSVPRTQGPSTTAPRLQAPTPIRRITCEEMQQRRERGLCFKCNEKFSPGHRCKTPQAYLIEADRLEDAEGSKDGDIEHYDENTTGEEAQPVISLHALSGWNGPRTMRVVACIQGHPLTVLIDSRSTHNFVSGRVAKLLQLPIDATVKFGVRVANGEVLQCQEIFRSVELELQGKRFLVDFYTLPLVGLDAVLGIQWLEKLGPVICDWKHMTMKFWWNGQACGLSGQPARPTRDVDFREIQKEIKGSSQLFAIMVRGAEEHQPTTVQKEWPTDLQQLIKGYSPLFEAPRGLPPERPYVHRIPLQEGTLAINVRPYRYAYYQKNEIERQVTEMLEAGIIKESQSPFSSPILLVKKKDGTWRFCTDYRALNAVTIKDRFPIPTVDDMLDELHGACYFSKLDLKAGYHQLRVHPDDVHKTAFRTHHGHFEYLVMPFGLCNAPSTFQAAMNSIFRSYLRKFILVFFDDILVYNATWELHISHLRTTLRILADHCFYLQPSKCLFGQQQVEYLGYIISAAGVQVDTTKIQAMKEWPRPTTVTELRGFLGLTGYYRKFVKSYGVIAAPLTTLLRKGQFQWNLQAEQAFHLLKQAMMTTPVLDIPNFSETFVVETDASDKGIGAVLTQGGKPVAYMSKALGVTKKGWSTYAKEMLAIMEAVRMWRPYLLGRKFQIRTDQKSLRHFLEQRVSTPEQQKWVTKLLGYEYEIVYKPEKDNSAADALSRLPEEIALHALSRPVFDIWEEIRTANQEDHYLQQKIQQLEATPDRMKNYQFRGGILYYKDRVLIPPSSPLGVRLMEEFHNTKIGGHSGTLRTYKRISQAFYWESMKKDIQKFVAECVVCQQHKYETQVPAGLLQPLPVPTQVWEDISMDFIEGLPWSKGKNVILVIVDRLTKYAHFLAISHPYTAGEVAALFVNQVARLHGMPRSIVSDRDPIFVSHFWHEFFKLQGTTLRMSSAYHPQSDGQTEVVNRCVEQYLRCLCNQFPKTWEQNLAWAEYWYNTTFHSTAGMTPFQALYGRAPPTIVRYMEGLTAVDEVDRTLANRDQLMKELKGNLEKAQGRMKQQADKNRREVTFVVGELVFLKLPPYRQQTIFRRVHQKLAQKYFGVRTLSHYSAHRASRL